jgi:RNA polymerase sigma factor for flagellar operon FliA
VSKRNDEILKNMPLVGFVVNRLSTDKTRTLGLDREDAMSYGVEGLIHAVDCFDPSRGVSFASFAIQRIRGSVLDAVRRQDPLPRSVRRNTRQIDQAGQELACQLGRWPTRKELAMRMGVTVRALQDMKQHASSRFVSLEHVLQDGARDGGRQQWDPVDNDDRGDPATAAEHNANLVLLSQAVNRLGERDREILRLRYEESLPFHKVGRLLGLSESRVCQLHKRILRQLRWQLEQTLKEAA